MIYEAITTNNLEPFISVDNQKTLLGLIERKYWEFTNNSLTKLFCKKVSEEEFASKLKVFYRTTPNGKPNKVYNVVVNKDNFKLKACELEECERWQKRLK